MKTKIEYRERYDKRKITLYHHPSIQILREIRVNPRRLIQSNGTPVEAQAHIVFLIPHTFKWKKENLKNIQKNYRESAGLQLIEGAEIDELLIYDRHTFGWILSDLEELKLFRYNEQQIPNWEAGEIMPMYINARGLQLLFNLFYLPFEIIGEVYCNLRDRKRKRRKT